MLHLIPLCWLPAPLHRAGLRLAHALRRRWWRLRAPRLAGCRVIALDAEGRVLLIRHSYGSGHWMPPGGGLARAESPVLAAMRELREETGCRLELAQCLEQVEEDLHGAGNQVHVVAGLTRDWPRPDGREVIAAAFFAIDALPDSLAPALVARLPGWITAAKAGHPPDGAAPRPGPPARTG